MSYKKRSSLPVLKWLSAYCRETILFIANLFTPPIKYRTEDYKIKNFFLRLSGMNLGERVVVGRGLKVWATQTDKVTLGSHVHLEEDVAIYPFKAVEIGELTSIGPSTIITTGSHRTHDYSPFVGEVKIGRGVFVGAGCRLLGPLTIGDNTMIAAGTTVTGNIPSGVVVTSQRGEVIGKRPLSRKVWSFEYRYYDPTSFKFHEQ